jgi:parallel beta-helix repeat protein
MVISDLFQEGIEAMWDGCVSTIISQLHRSENISLISIFVLGAVASILFVPVSAHEENISFDGDSSFNLINCSRIVWHIDPSTGHLSLPSLRSGPIQSGGASCVAKTIEGPAMINFWWKVDQDIPKVGMLVFIVDNETVLQCTSSDWSPVDYAVSSGSHQLRWVYRKMHSYPEYAGAGWIDDLNIAYPEGKMSDMQSKKANCCDQFPSTSVDFNRMYGNLSRLESKVGQIDLKIWALSSNQTALENGMSTIGGSLVSVNGSINDLVSRFNLSALDDRLRGLDIKIEDFNRTITNLSFNQIPSNNLSWISENIVYVSNNSVNLEEIINKNKNKVILLDDGVYHTGGLNIITSDIHIISLRKWGAILDADKKSNGVILDTVRNVTLDSLTIVNCKNGIHIENSTDCDIVRNRINDVDDIGIIVKNSNRTVLMLNEIDALEKTEYVGIKLNKSDNNTIIFNDININKHDYRTSLYKIRSSKDNIIYTSDDGIIWDDSCGADASCTIRDNEYKCKLNNGHGDIVNLTNCSANTWGFLK